MTILKIIKHDKRKMKKQIEKIINKEDCTVCAYICSECGWVGWEKPKGICPRTGKKIKWKNKIYKGGKNNGIWN